MGKPPQWEEFYAWLLETYWPAVPPDVRFESRPDAPEDDPEVPQDIWKACLLIMPDPEAWLHNPIPAFKRKTPLELLKAGKGDKLRETLQSVAATFLPPPSELVYWEVTSDAGADEAE